LTIVAISHPGHRYSTDVKRVMKGAMDAIKGYMPKTTSVIPDMMNGIKLLLEMTCFPGASRFPFLLVPYMLATVALEEAGPDVLNPLHHGLNATTIVIRVPMATSARTAFAQVVRNIFNGGRLWPSADNIGGNPALLTQAYLAATAFATAFQKAHLDCTSAHNDAVSQFVSREKLARSDAFTPGMHHGQQFSVPAVPPLFQQAGPQPPFHSGGYQQPTYQPYLSRRGGRESAPGTGQRYQRGEGGRQFGMPPPSTPSGRRRTRTRVGAARGAAAAARAAPTSWPSRRWQGRRGKSPPLPP